MNTLAVPFRLYSWSSLAGRLGRTGSGSRTSPISCLPPSSRQTTGRLGSCGRWYTSSTSSIAATKPALALGGITHCCFSHGLSAFFQRPPDGLVAGGVHHLQLDEPVGQHLQRPAGLPGRGRGAGDGDQPGLLVAVEFAVLPAGRLLPVEGQVQPTVGELLADPGHRPGAAVEGLGDRRVVPPRGAPGNIRLEQDAGVDQGPGRVLAGAGHPLQFPAVAGGQADDVLVLEGHGGPPSRLWARKSYGTTSHISCGGTLVLS